MVALRTSTMLVALIVVPTIAMFGMSWRPLVDSSKPKAPQVGIARPTPLGPVGPASWEAGAAAAAPSAPSAPTARVAEARPIVEPTRPAPDAAPLSPAPSLPPDDVQLSRAAAAKVPGLDAEWFRAMIGRLRAAGATDYLLERWGSSEELYRFQCNVAEPAGSVRHFEATHTDAARAMQAVFAQIDAWHSGLRP